MDRLFWLQRLHTRHGGDGGQARPLAGFKPKIRAKCLWKQENIGKEDRCIKAIAADRLQGDLGGEIGVVAQLKEIPGFSPRRAILGQIAPRLPHHPDRRGRQCLATKGAQKKFGHGGLRRSLCLACLRAHVKKRAVERRNGRG